MFFTNFKKFGCIFAENNFFLKIQVAIAIVLI